METLVWKSIKKPDVSVVVNGFSVEGKTSFVYRIKLDDVRRSIPKFDVNGKHEKKKNVTVMGFNGWGRESARPFLSGATEAADAVVFIVDTTEMERVEEDKREFDSYYYEDPIFAIAVNNYDVEGAVSISQVQKIFDVENLKKKYMCEVFPVSTTKGEGICEIMEWVWLTLKEKKEKQKQKERSEKKMNDSFFKAPGEFIKRLFTKI